MFLHFTFCSILLTLSRGIAHTEGAAGGPVSYSNLWGGGNSGMARRKPAVPAELRANEQGAFWSRSVIITSLASLWFLCIQLSTPPGILSSLLYIILFSNRLFIEWNNGEKPQS